MKITLSIILVLIGAVEIIAAVMDPNMPIMIGIVLGIIFIGLGVKALLDAGKRRQCRKT